MADLKALANHRTAVLWFDPRKLKVKPGLNIRDMTAPDTIAHVEWLATSIAEEGIKTPLKIFTEGDEIYIASGHCRHAAVMMAIARGAEVQAVPCIPEPRGTNEQERFLDQQLDNSGKPLTILEASANIKRILARGWTIDDVAKKLGRSVSYVHQALDLQGAPAEIHEAIKAGEISATLATQIVRDQGSDQAKATIKEAVKEAKAQGKRKVTRKSLKPISELKKVKEPKRAKGQWETSIRPFPGGEMCVMFGETAVTMTRKQWGETCDKILDYLEGKSKAA